jgi:galactonate dehydratase
MTAGHRAAGGRVSACPFCPSSTSKTVLRNLRTHLAAMREGAGPDVDLLLDLNFNAKTKGYLKILKAIADFDMFWVEIDSYRPEALGYFRRKRPHRISSCETLLGLREFLPYFRDGRRRRSPTPPNPFKVYITPDNFYGHLATMMNAHFAAALPNLRIMEIDIDRLPWDEEVFTAVLQFEDSRLVVLTTPGWGTEPHVEAICAHRQSHPADCCIIQRPEVPLRMA